MGKPGFPIPQRTRAGGPRTRAPARGRVWEGYALPGTTFFHPVGAGGGETGFPHILARGRVWEGQALPVTTFFHPVGVAQGGGETWFPHILVRGRV